MRQAWHIARLHLTRSFKSVGNLFMMFLLPLLLTLIVGMLAGGQGSPSGARGQVYPVAVVDEDQTFASAALVEALSLEPTLRLERMDISQMKKRFGDKALAAGLVIPAGFEQGVAAGTAPEVQLVTAPGGNLSLGVGPIVRRQATRLAQDYLLALRATGGKPGDPRVEEAYQKVIAERAKLTTPVQVTALTRAEAPNPQQGQVSPVSHVSVGFTVTFVMMMVFMMSGVILKERQDGTWGRLLTTPVPRVTVLVGYLLSFFLTGMAQFAILVAATRLLFGVQWGPLLPLAAMGAGTVLSAGGMGLFLAGMIRTYEQQVTIGVLFVNATSMLGGVYWDLAMVGETMRRIAYLTPQAWAMEGFKEIMLRGGSWAGLQWPLTVLLGITAVFLTAGLLRVRYE